MTFTRGQIAEAAAGIGAYATKTIAFDGLEFTGDLPSKASLTTSLTGANEIWHDATPDASIELSSVATEKIVNQDIQALVGTAAISDGTLTFHCIWKPISTDGNVTAA